MDKASGSLTVYFGEPFWVGVFEVISDGKLSVCKVTFGAGRRIMRFGISSSKIITVSSLVRL